MVAVLVSGGNSPISMLTVGLELRSRTVGIHGKNDVASCVTVKDRKK